jgi:hypothetical protein
LTCDEWAIEPTTTSLDVSKKGLKSSDVTLLAGVLKGNAVVQWLHAYGNAFGRAGGEAFAGALKTNKTLEEIHVGNMMVGSTVRLKSSGEEKVVTAIDVTNYDDSPTTHDNIQVQGSNSKIKPSEFDPIPAVIPVKQLRENTITRLDLSNKGLGVDGGLILAALIKDNTSVQQLDVSANGLGVDGGKALAASIAENRTITSVRSLFCEIVFSVLCSYFQTCTSCFYFSLLPSYSHHVRSSMSIRMVSMRTPESSSSPSLTSPISKCSAGFPSSRSARTLSPSWTSRAARGSSWRHVEA